MTQRETTVSQIPASHRTGVMLIGHGTRDEKGTQQFFELGDVLADSLAPSPVVSCLLEFQKPTIPEAWDKLVELGVIHIHAAPLLLFAAGHAKQDIPELLAECQSRTPHICFWQSGPLSRHESIVNLVCQRVQSQMENKNPKTTALVMVGRGSHDPCAQADMRVLTEIIGHRFVFRHVATAFYAMAQPRLPEVLDQIASLPDVSDVIVQPHLLFEGRLYHAIEEQVRAASRSHRHVAFETSSYLGPVDLVAKSIIGRLQSQQST